MREVAAALRRRDLIRLGFGAIRFISAGAGRRISRGTMTEQRPSTLGLIGDAISNASNLFSSEVALAKTEIGEKMTSAIMAVASIAGAAVFLIVALIFLLQALVEWLVEIGWRPSLASLLVGVGIGAAALAAILIAKNKLTVWRLAPSRTLNQAAKTMDAVRGKAV